MAVIELRDTGGEDKLVFVVRKDPGYLDTVLSRGGEIVLTN